MCGFKLIEDTQTITVNNTNIIVPKRYKGVIITCRECGRREEYNPSKELVKDFEKEIQGIPLAIAEERHIELSIYDENTYIKCICGNERKFILEYIQF